jgi:hypothetical protein
MTQFKATRFRALLGSAAVFALLFGLEFPNPQLTGGPAPLPNDHTIAVAANEPPSGQSQVQTDENATDAAKAGKESGAQSDDNADKDAEKPDQPPGAHPGNAN